MRATSRAAAALALTTAVLLPALPASALPGQDPAPAGSAAATTPTGLPVKVELNAEGEVPAPPVAADSWVVADLDSGAILAQQNPDLAVRPASTLKLLTALTVMPRLAPEQPYRAVAADEEAEGNRVVLYEGLTYTVGDLLHASLLPSANDAAAALARANGGIRTTVEQMNAEAKRLGATSTTVKNPSGLDDEGQLTTARDMALIGRAAYANPEIAAALQLREVPFPGAMEAGKRVVYPVYNHNRTVAHNRLPGYLGGKSGYTSKAGNTLVAAADRDGHRLLVTLFHIGGNTYRSGEALLNWGLANYDALRPIGQLAEPTAPAPQFDRTILPLPKKGEKPVSREAAAAAASDAPTATTGASSFTLSGLALPGLPSMPSPLTLLTLLMAVVVALRARVYWIAHRHRTAWTSLDDWARGQAGSARRAGPADPRVGTAAESASTGATSDGDLVSSSR
jgi:D-alanyl-D-alanine carboxypeptidase (penicillin-binding protein 5/6)